MEQTYKIIRFFEDWDLPRQVIATGLTREEAQAHCNDPETSSRTCTSAEGRQRTEDCGAWFDGWEVES